MTAQKLSATSQQYQLHGGSVELKKTGGAVVGAAEAIALRTGTGAAPSETSHKPRVTENLGRAFARLFGGSNNAPPKFLIEQVAIELAQAAGLSVPQKKSVLSGCLLEPRFQARSEIEQRVISVVTQTIQSTMQEVEEANSYWPICVAANKGLCDQLVSRIAIEDPAFSEHVNLVSQWVNNLVDHPLLHELVVNLPSGHQLRIPGATMKSIGGLNATQIRTATLKLYEKLIQVAGQTKADADSDYIDWQTVINNASTTNDLIEEAICSVPQPERKILINFAKQCPKSLVDFGRSALESASFYTAFCKQEINGETIIWRASGEHVKDMGIEGRATLFPSYVKSLFDLYAPKVQEVKANHFKDKSNEPINEASIRKEVKKIVETYMKLDNSSAQKHKELIDKFPKLANEILDFCMTSNPIKFNSWTGVNGNTESSAYLKADKNKARIFIPTISDEPIRHSQIKAASGMIYSLINRLDGKSELGSGGFGRVRFAIDSEGILRAVKKVLNFESAQVELSAAREMVGRAAEKNLPLSKLVLPVDYATREVGRWPNVTTKTYLFMPVAQGGNGEDAINLLKQMHLKMSPEEFSKQCKTIALGCAESLKQLHDLGIYHRDIKPENFLLFTETPDIAERWDLKLGDFGGVTTDKDKEWFGTDRYLPPEALTTDIETDPDAHDAFALGLALCEMLLIQRASSLSNFYLLINSNSGETREIEVKFQDGHCLGIPSEHLADVPQVGSSENTIAHLLNSDPKKRLSVTNAYAAFEKL